MNLKEFQISSIVGLFTGNGTGTKVFQGFFDGHPNIYMIPGYPLTYFYPHWEKWEKELANDWNWISIIEIFCEKHASVIDTRRIPGHDGSTKLGNEMNEYTSINEKSFRKYLLEILENEPISSKNFLLAIHYSYALCNKQTINKENILFYHIHRYDFLKYLIDDFPNVKILAMTRDPRSSYKGRFTSAENFDDAKLNMTDSIRNRKYIQLNSTSHYCYNLYELIKYAKINNIKIVRHEDIYYDPKEILQLCCKWLNIKYSQEMETVTFGGKVWWGDEIYNMPPTKGVYDRTVSEEWKTYLNKRDWFILEGIFWDCFVNYNYNLLLYNKDSIFNRIKLLFIIMFPLQSEIKYLKSVFSSIHFKYLRHSYQEAADIIPLKDYTWHATYLFKKSYKHLKLYKPSLYRNICLKLSSNPFKIVKILGIYIYLFSSYIQFILSILTYPIVYIQRCYLMYHKLFKRFNDKNILPSLINCNSSKKL